MSLWSDSGGERRRFGGEARGTGHVAAVERVKDWTRGRFGLAEDDIVMLVESQSALPGFPPFETHVAFWPADGERRQFKVFKRVDDVGEEDIPPAWLADALRHDPTDCSCC